MNCQHLKFPHFSRKIYLRNGEFQVLTNHAPIISSLVAGKISYTSGAETQSLQIAGGFADINNNQISVCVEL